MNGTPPTHREVYSRWTFTYYVYPPARPGTGFLAEAHIREGAAVKRVFMCSRSGPADEMQERLRGWCVEWALDQEDPSRVEKRNQRTIGDRISAGLAGEKGT